VSFVDRLIVGFAGFDFAVVGGDYDIDESVECRLRLPAELGFGFGGIANEKTNFGGTEISGIDFHDDLSRPLLMKFLDYFLIFFF
jgi:hypothetical protein